MLQNFIGAKLFASAKPILNIPANNSTAYSRNPSFLWAGDADAYTYEIEIATDILFTNIVSSRTGLYIPRYVPLKELPVANLYWHVRSYDTLNTASGWSNVSSYQIINYTNIYNIADGASFATVKQTIATAAANTPALVKFASNGTYNLDPGGGTYMFNLVGVNDLMIDGNHSSITIMNHLETGFMQFKNCNRVTVKRLSVDWNPLPHSFADVIKVNNSDANVLNINVRLRKVAGQQSPYYPRWNDTAFTKYWSWGCLMDPTNHGALKNGVANLFGIAAIDVTPFACTNPAEYNVFKRGPTYSTAFAVGDVLAIVCREGVGSLLNNTNCVDITYDSIINYSSPTSCYTLAEGSDLKVLSCNSAIKDTTRFLSANADGVHCGSNVIGPWVENSSFVDNGDDGIALYSKGIFVKSKTSTTNLSVMSNYMNIQSGDVFDIYTPQTGEIISDSFHLTADPTLSSSIYNLNFLPAMQNADYTAMTNIGNADLQQNVQLYSKTRYNNYFMISNNLITVRARGIIIRSMNGVVENNRLYDCSATAVALYNEPSSWANGLNNTNIKVLNNDIRDCAFDNLGVEAGAITVKFLKINWNGSSYSDTLSSILTHSKILIKGNRIHNFAKYGIVLGNAKSSCVLNNTFTNTVPGFIQPGNHYGIYLNRTDSCIVAGNNLSGDTRTLTNNIQIENSTNATVVP